MRFRPSSHVLFWFLEAALIGGHFAFPELPHLAGQIMFWAGVAGLIIWVLAHLGMLDWAPFMARFSGHSSPTRDTKIGDAIAYISYRQWGISFVQAAGGNPPQGIDSALHDFQQAAADGRIQVWGKRNWAEIFEPINSEYWRKYQIEWFSLLRGRTITEPAVVGVKRGDEYLDLMTSRSQLEAIWPRKRRRMRFQLPWTVKDA